MGRATYWCGSPEATKKREFLRLVEHLRPSSSEDVFFDLGCGFGNPCIWIADWVKCAVGFETYIPRYRRARIRAEKSRLTNASILRKNFERASFREATIIYSTLGIIWRTIKRINKECKQGSRLILFYEPFPIKSLKLHDSFIMTVLLDRFVDENHFANSCYHLKTIRQVYHKIGNRSFLAQSLKRDIAHKV